MKTIVIAACINFLFSMGATAQNQNRLLEYEMQIYNCASDTAKAELLYEKFRFQLMSSENINEAEKTLQRIDSDLLDSLKRKIFYWNAALYALLADDEQLAMQYHEHYTALTHDSSETSMCLGFLSAFKIDRTYSERCLHKLTAISATYMDMSCLYTTDDYIKKHKGLYIGFSIALPGSGLMLLGKPVKGLVALSLTGLSIWAVAALWQNTLYLNAVLLGGMLLTKFYPGNIRLTETEFRKSESKKKQRLANNCEPLINNLISTVKFR